MEITVEQVEKTYKVVITHKEKQYEFIAVSNEVNNKINVRVYFWDTSKNEITFKEKDYYKREIEKEIRKKIIKERDKSLSDKT